MTGLLRAKAILDRNVHAGMPLRNRSGNVRPRGKQRENDYQTGHRHYDEREKSISRFARTNKRFNDPDYSFPSTHGPLLKTQMRSAEKVALLPCGYRPRGSLTEGRMTI